jgi:16S rRNA (cytosine1402-N4)-methyltransferase
MQLTHIPVMKNEVLELLAPTSNQNFLDCTIGGGGHSRAILEKTGPAGKIWGIDRDPYALKRAGANLKEFESRVQFIHGKFSEIDSLVSDEIVKQLNGVLIDCGVSSFQLDDEQRGFSFRYDAPLDMRMNPKDSMSAMDFLYQASENEIAEVIYKLGEERNSRKIARNIVNARNEAKLNTTFDLVDAVTKSFPPRSYWKINPATKTFQAIRMKINSELEEIHQGILALIKRMPGGSKLVVITFHSLEDRLVKHLFKKASLEKRGKLINKKPFAATREESKHNSRARSAKVRGIEILPHEKS